MGKKLKNLSITPLPLVASTPSTTATVENETFFSPLPLVASTPSTATIVEDVTPISLVPGMVGNGSPPSPHSSLDSGYFPRSGKKVQTGGLGKDSHPVSRGRGRTSFLEKAWSRARKDLHEGKQLYIEWAIRAVQA